MAGRLYAAGPIVWQDARRGVVHVAVCPRPVGHPEIFYHLGPAREVALEDLAVEEALFADGRHVGVARPFGLELRVGIELLGELFEIFHRAVAHGVGEGGFLAIEDVVGQIVSLEALAQQAFAHTSLVEFLFGVDAHDVAHEGEVAKRHTRLQAVARYAAVRPQHVIHIQLADALDGLLLKGLGARGVVGILVSEELV